MNAEQKKDIIKSIVVLTLICLVVSSALAIVNSVTAPVSAAHAAERGSGARREIVPEAARFAELSLDGLPEAIQDACRAEDADGNALGYVFTVKGDGFGGAITIICGIDPEGYVLRSIAMDLSSETPTLGGRTGEPAYADQYIGKGVLLEGIEAISGATITSRGYESCIHRAFEAYNIVKEAGA